MSTLTPFPRELTPMTLVGQVDRLTALLAQHRLARAREDACHALLIAVLMEPTEPSTVSSARDALSRVGNHVLPGLIPPGERVTIAAR